VVARRQGVRHGTPWLHDDGELVGVYYDKQLLADLGLTVPTTFSDFGRTPGWRKQAWSGADRLRQQQRVPGIHEYAEIQDQMAPTSYLTDPIFGTQRAASRSPHRRTPTQGDDSELGERRLLLTGVRRQRKRTPS
jgi:hypothetical protein